MFGLGGLGVSLTGGTVFGVEVPLYLGRGVSGNWGEVLGFRCSVIRIVVVISVPLILCSIRTSTIVGFRPVVFAAVVFPTIGEDSNDVDESVLPPVVLPPVVLSNVEDSNDVDGLNPGGAAASPPPM